MKALLCQSATLEGAVVDVQAGGMVRQYADPLDLCQECSERFSDWLKSGRQANHHEPGGALADTAVASLALN